MAEQWRVLYVRVGQPAWMGTIRWSKLVLYTLKYTRTHKNYTNTCTYAIHKWTCTHPHTHAQAHTNEYVHTQIHMHIRHTQMNMYTPTYTCTSTHNTRRTHLIQDTGRAMANHDSQLGGSPSMDMRSMAKIFWGEEMGLVMPPILDAKATPITC